MFKRLKNAIKTTAVNKAKKDRVLAVVLSEYYYLKLQREGTLRGNNILETIDFFLDSEHKTDKKYLQKVEKDMLFSHLYYQICNMEYFLFRFEDLSDAGRKKYMGFHELMSLYRQLNSKGNPEIFDNKGKTYEKFKTYYKRDILIVEKQTPKDAFVNFLLAHKPCLLKPLNKYGGKGIFWIKASNKKEAESFYETYSPDLPFLLEEKIEQDSDMAAFHPQSINTIRYNTFFNDNRLFRLQAVFRIGTGDSIVDNATSGGIYALVDIETGIIKSAARSDKGEYYLIHPTTGEQIIGRRIPRWEELNCLIEEIVRIVPEQKQVGWDFALSKNGWVMVEGNTRPAIQSFDCDHPMKDELTKIYLSYSQHA